MPDDLARATVRIDPDLSYFKESLRSKLATETEGVSADVSVKASLEGFARTDAEVQALGGDVTYKVKPELDLAAVAEVKAQEEGLSHELEHTNEALTRSTELMAAAAEKASALGGTVGGTLTPALQGAGEAAGGASEGISGLLTAAVTLGPALIPVIAGATAAIGALIPVTIAAGAGVAAFALAAASQLGPLTAEFKDLLSTFQRLAAPDVIPVVHSAMALLPELFSNMLPVVHSVSGEMEHLTTAARSALEAPFWRNFVTLIQSQAGPALGSFTTLIGGVVKGLAGVAEAFAPFVGVVESALSRTGDAIANWGQNLGSSSGFQSFINYVRTEGPQVLTILDNLWKILLHVGEGLAPLGAALVAILGPLTSFINAILSWNPIFTAVLTTLATLGAAIFLLRSPLVAAIGWVTDFVKGFQAFTSAAPAMADAFAAFTEGATGAGAGLAGLLASTGGLAGLALVAAPAAAGLALITGGLALAAIGTHNFDAEVRNMIGGVEQLPTATLPELQRALDATRGKMDNLAHSGELLKTAIATGKGGGYIVDTATGAAVDELDRYVKTLTTDIHTQNANLDELHKKFGISRDSAAALAQTLGLNLDKSLNTAQLVQFGVALQNQAVSAGIAATALENLSKISGHTTSAISTDIKNATTATATSWKSFGDAITAFQGQTNVSADKITEFYGKAEYSAAEFNQNIQKLAGEGFDPRFLSEAIQAGPGQAGNLINSIASQSAAGVKTVMSQALTVMNQLAGQAVEQSRLTQEAVQAPTSTFAAALPRALSISQALMGTNSRQAIASLVSTFQGGLPAFAKIANEYGIQLPTSLAESIGLTVTKSGQLQAAATGPLAAGVPKAAKAGTDMAVAATTALASHNPQATAAGAGLAEANRRALAGGGAAAVTAAGDTAHKTATAFGHHTDESTKSGGAHSKAFTDAISKGDVTKAANILVTAFAGALAKDTKPVQAAGDDLGKALLKGIESFKDDLGKSGDDLGTALTKQIASYDDDMQRAGADLARNLALGMTSQSGAVDAARTTATQIVNTIEQVVRAGVPVVQSDANRIGQAIARAITDHTGDTHSAIAAMVTDFIQVIDSGVSRSQNEGTKLAQAIVTGINSVNLSDAARTLVSQFVSGLSNTSGAYNAGRGLANAAAQGAASVGSGTFQQIGLSFTQGITAGINNSAAQSQLQAAAANTAHTAVNAAAGSGGLKKSSPSRLTHDELGIPFVQGFEQGITDSLSSLMRTSAGAATAAVSGGKAGLTTSALTARLPGGVAASAPAAGGTTLNYTPTYHIQGGADPDTVRKFQAMLDAHDRDLVHTIQSLT